MQYGELHAHDEWSLLDGCGTAAHGARRAAECGHSFLAKTNHGVLSGAIHHMDACYEAGIIPITAVEAYYRPQRQPFDKTNWSYYHLVLLAKNAVGWRHLKLLTSEAFKSGFYRYPCVDDELLDRWHEGLIFSTSCVSGFVPRAILLGDDVAAREHMDKLDRWAGDDWYGELQPHDFDDLRAVNRELVGLMAERGRPLVATKDAHFPEPEWAETQHVSVAIRTSRKLVHRSGDGDEDERYDMMAPETCYIGSADDTRALFAQHHPSLPASVVDEAVRNTGDIAERCVPFVIDTSPKVPRFYASRDRSYSELRRLVFEGLARRGRGDERAYVEQAERELEILRAKDFCDFFLIIADVVRWARSTEPLQPLPGGTLESDSFFRYTEVGGGRERPMLVSIRGSAGASTVSYALGITTINPITWGGRFERFLNPDREGLPDFDLDFAPGDADLVKECVKRKYGADRVYDMIAHGTLRAKAAITRVSMVYDVPWSEVKAATKMIDRDDNDDPLEDLRGQIRELDLFFERWPEVFKHGSRLQFQVGTISEHAAAVVLSDRPMAELMPVMKKSVKDDYMVTAFGESAKTQIVSRLGFLKLDLLVVTELAKLAYAYQLIGRHYDQQVELDKLSVWEDPYAVDEGAMEVIRRAALMGVFQLGGSPSIASLTKKVAPQNALQIADICAVHRTATMTRGIHNEYAERRRHPEKIAYWHPSVVPFLERTLGLMIYQEQVMDILSALGGFSPARADTVRRIMSKYYRAAGDLAERMLAEHHDDFVSSASGIVGGSSEAEMIWNNVAGFSSYAFNIPHAGQYGNLGYADAWIKNFYPDCFYAAMLTFPPSKIKKPEQRRPFYEKAVREARLFGVDILPPDVNDSERSFTITRDGVRFGLSGIKGLGPASVVDLIAGRPYADLAALVDWTSRPGAKCNSGGRRALGSAGALDCFGARDHLTADERAEMEEERVGVALSAPDRIGPLHDALARLLHTQAEVEEAPQGAQLVVGGEVVGGRETVTRKGPALKLEMVFGADEYSVSVPPWGYTDGVRELIDSDKPLVVRGSRDIAYDCVQADEVALAEDVVGMVTA